MGRRNNDVTDQQIIDLYMEVKNGIKVAHMLGINDRTVYNVLASNNIESLGRQEYIARAQRFDPEEMQDVLTRYNNGETAAAIAKHYDCATVTVTTALRRYGTRIRGSYPQLSDAEKKKIVRLYVDERMSMKAIGKRLGGRPERAIHRFLKAEHPEIIRPKNASGEQASGWKGGKFFHKGSGYMYVKMYEDDPFWDMRPKSSNGYILEHRLVLARKLGRAIRKDQTVNHIDGDKTNNHPDNLELRQGKHGKHIPMRCLDCGSQNIVPAPLNSH